MTQAPVFAQWAKDGALRIFVRLTPKAQADRIDGTDPARDGLHGALQVRVRALPSEGAANAALIALLAREGGLPKSALAVATGGRSRLKTVVARAEAPALLCTLQRLEMAAGIAK